MKTLFLTSSISGVAHDLPRHFPKGTKGLRLAFIDTAAEVETGDMTWLKDDRQSLVDVGFSVSDYTVTGKTQKEIVTDLSKVDTLFFSGGNTFYLLQQLQKSDSMGVICDFVQSKEKIYMGASAGSILVGPDISPVRNLDREALATELTGYSGLSLINFVIMPHWGSEHFREAYLDKQTLERVCTIDQYPLLLLTDTQYVHVKDDWHQIVDVSKTV